MNRGILARDGQDSLAINEEPFSDRKYLPLTARSRMIQELDKEHLALMIPFIAILSGVAIACTAIITQHIRKTREAEWLASLKSQMLEQGLSPEDIERVLAAGPGPQLVQRRNPRSCRWT
jgi:hypothetical protein